MNSKLITHCHSERQRRIPKGMQRGRGSFTSFRMTLHVAFNSWRSQAGQALVTLLFFMIVAITITSGAVVILFTNSLSASKLELGTYAYYYAESGAEDALMRLLRDPDGTVASSPQTLTIENANVVTTVSKSGSNYTINSDATGGNFRRTIQVVASFVSNIFAVTSWKEIF